MALVLLKNVPTSGLQCALYQLNPTVDPKAKVRTYIAFQHESQLNGPFHHNAAQVERSEKQEIVALAMLHVGCAFLLLPRNRQAAS
jgi:hypothetical protein